MSSRSFVAAGRAVIFFSLFLSSLEEASNETFGALETQPKALSSLWLYFEWSFSTSKRWSFSTTRLAREKLGKMLVIQEVEHGCCALSRGAFQHAETLQFDKIGDDGLSAGVQIGAKSRD